MESLRNQFSVKWDVIMSGFVEQPACFALRFRMKIVEALCHHRILLERQEVRVHILLPGPLSPPLSRQSWNQQDDESDRLKARSTINTRAYPPGTVPAQGAKRRFLRRFLLP